MGIEQNQQSVVNDSAAMLVSFLDGITRESLTKTTRFWITPILVRHFFPVRPEPAKVLRLAIPNLPSIKELPAPQRRVLPKQLSQKSGKIQ